MSVSDMAEHSRMQIGYLRRSEQRCLHSVGADHVADLKPDSTRMCHVNTTGCACFVSTGHHVGDGGGAVPRACGGGVGKRRRVELESTDLVGRARAVGGA
eukprot:954927-Rhodomonas_salina.3